MHNILALIPARGGSKRLKGKNIKQLGEKPLIAWSIEVALASKYVDEVVVSTEDDEIAKVSQQYGATVPFKRPYMLSLDSTSTMDVILHTIETLESEGKAYKFLMLLQPTSPLRSSEDIDKSVELMIQKEADSIISVCESEHSPLWTNTLPKDHSMDNFLPKKAERRSQELPTYYRLNGAIYIAKTEMIKKEKSFFMPNSFAYIMPQSRSVDIDSELDFKLAEILVQDKKLTEKI